MRQADRLLVADDAVPGAYFSVPIPKEPSALIALRGIGVGKVLLPAGSLATDFEGMDRLADGRLALLSERLRSLVGEEGLIVQYDSLLGEFANRGLEGVAVRPLPGGASRVAVVWEGGYPDFAAVPWSLRNTAGRQAMRPLVVVHDLSPGARGVELKMRDAALAFELELPKPAGDEPQAQRFRAPDLVWTRSPNAAGDDWSLLVLITSQNSVEQPQYLHHWLQRFDMNGRPVAEPLDLSQYLPQESRNANWEGLAWFEPGKSLVLVHEANPRLPAQAFILSLPPDWQYTAGLTEEQ
jgi:hypothetical protein